MHCIYYVRLGMMAQAVFVPFCQLQRMSEPVLVTYLHQLNGALSSSRQRLIVELKVMTGSILPILRISTYQRSVDML